MIKRVYANKDSFKAVEFSTGFNVVMADRTKESTVKDSRNGLGKSTLLEIIHFCLGAGYSRNKGLVVEPLAGWEFSVDLLIGSHTITATRCVDDPGYVYVSVDTSGCHANGGSTGKTTKCSAKEWNKQLVELYFGLSADVEEYKYLPTFRSLISYFIRRGKDAFSIPFEHFRRQQLWDIQVNNAFLLGLAWQDASVLQDLKERKKAIQNFASAAKAGVVSKYIGSLGDLEAKKVRVKAQADKEEEYLQSFKVHPEYIQIQTDANNRTEEIHTLVNANASDRRLLQYYERNLSDEQPPDTQNVQRIYKEAGVALPDVALRRIEEVQEFHNHIIKNRKEFLSTEIDRLKKGIDLREVEIEKKTDERSKIMEVLKTHGALEEYTLLQERHMGTVNQLNEITTMIEDLRKFEKSKSEIKISIETWRQKARKDYDERHMIRERAISLFNEHSELLYDAPGQLVINIDDKGFKYDVEIERSGSAGISNMKVFCYDLMLAKLWSNKEPSPRLLIHDSTIFDGVDERQRARALEMAARESASSDFQYICTLNSDYIPTNEFSEDFNIEEYVKLKLTDKSADGCLLGIRF